MFYDWHGRMAWIGRTDSGVSRQRLRERFKIDTFLYSLLDPGAKVHIAACRAEGSQTGGYIDPHWFGLSDDGEALQFRQKTDELVAAVGMKANDHLQIDCELVSPEFLRRTVEGSTGNRGLFGSKNTQKPTGTQADKRGSYTNMPFQNHTVVDFPVIARYGLHWFPQLYYGDMSPADASAVILEILRDMRAWAGANYAEQVHPFHDGLKYTTDQRDAAWFTAERLPGIFGFAAEQPVFAATLDLQKSLTRTTLREYYKDLANSA